MNCLKTSTLSALAAAAFLGVTARAEFMAYEEAPVFYSDSKANDPVAKIIDDYESGKLTFDRTGEKAFLKSVLDHFGVPVETQVLVFSKTSFQNDRITPVRPRAIYYSNDYYLGWVQGGDIEIIAFDPDLGPIFYRMSTPFGRYPEPEIVRDSQCMNCHGSSRTGGYPGMLVRSLYADEIGAPIFGAGTRNTDHSSPLEGRWGGWFVTGDKAGERHKGNLYYREGEPGEAIMEKDFGRGPATLKEAINTDKYLVDTSDIVSLMVMEHQLTAHNALAKAHLDTRRWLYIDAGIREQTGRAKDELSESTKGLIDRGADDLLEAMLFKEEAPLEDWGVEGSEAFQEAFLAAGKSTADGDSLREFNLLSRMFRNRLSYTIHTSAFDDLHPMMKAKFCEKLVAALRGETEAAAHLGEKERGRIIAILRETKPEIFGDKEMDGEGAS